MGQFWAVLVWDGRPSGVLPMTNRFPVSSNRPDGFTMVAFSKPKRKFRIRLSRLEQKGIRLYLTAGRGVQRVPLVAPWWRSDPATSRRRRDEAKANRRCLHL